MTDAIELVIGRAHSFTLTVTNRDTGLPVHINGSTLFFTIKRSVRNSDAAALVRLSVGGGITILDTGAEDDNKGKATVTIVASDWATFDPYSQTHFPWDLVEVTGGQPVTIMGTPVGDDPIRLQLGVNSSVA